MQQEKERRELEKFKEDNPQAAQPKVSRFKVADCASQAYEDMCGSRL